VTIVASTYRWLKPALLLYTYSTTWNCPAGNEVLTDAFDEGNDDNVISVGDDDDDDESTD
jgi:hypothetical protein